MFQHEIGGELRTCVFILLPLVYSISELAMVMQSWLHGYW